MPSLAAVLKLLAVLLILAAPTALLARNQVEYGRYLGTRLRMYQEAYEVLDKAIKDSSGAEQARAKQAKAEVIKAEADNTFAEDADEEARLERYEAALAVFGKATEPVEVLARGRLLLEIANELRRIDAAKARAYCDEASGILGEKRKQLVDLRDSRDPKFEPHAATFDPIYYYYCYSFYIKALTYDFGSSERENALKEAVKWIGEFIFDSPGGTREYLLSYELQGDVSIARGDTEAAVSKFLELVGYLDGFTPTPDAGEIALRNGYLRAAELLTTELDYDPRNLDQAISLYSEAFGRYGEFTELSFWFKRFELYRVSALIKQGKHENIRGAVDALFKLATDRDPAFRRSALTVLAEVAARPELDNELRFRCAETVFADMASNPTNVILKNIYAYQSLLSRCNDVKSFETYGPACLSRIGEMYFSMWRFLDAAITYRDATWRTSYFVDKFADAEEVPEHMRGRCPLIRTPESLRGFAGEMSQKAAANAKLLLSPDYGDPDNRVFKELSDELERLKATFGGAGALLDLEFDKARALYGQKQFARAAARLLRLPASYRRAHAAVYTAAKAYSLLTDDPSGRRINSSGADDERESDEFFAQQAARHAADLAKLPESMWKGVETAHFAAIRDSATPDALANWHKAVYFYKKYFLLEVLRAWEDVKPLLAEVENPSLVDGLNAVAQVKNAAWIAAARGDQAEPDYDMRRMGAAAYDLAYLLRTPPKGISSQVSERIKAEGRSLALALLRPFWNMYGAHLKSNPEYQKKAQAMAFRALADEGDAGACEQLYLSFKEAFPGDADLGGMVITLFNLITDAEGPRVQALVNLRSQLTSRSAILKRNQFVRISPDFQDDAKKLADAKSRYERQQVLAQHFWNVWMKEYIFESKSAAAIPTYMKDVQERIEKRWNELAEAYTKRWADAMTAQFSATLKDDRFKSIRARAEQAAKGDALTLLERLEQEAAQARKDKRIEDEQLLQQLVTGITLHTDELQYFIGAMFIYEFGEFLEEVAEEVNQAALPSVSRILKYLEDARLAKGDGGLDRLTPDQLRQTGEFYFMIGDWKSVVRYFDLLVEKSESGWGKVEEIPVDVRQKIIGRLANADELAVRYMLGKASMELHKQSGDKDLLVKAALNLRRCWSFNQIRDTNMKIPVPYKLGQPRPAAIGQAAEAESLRPVIELYYVVGAQSMAECYLLLHEQGDIKIEWPKYVSQVTATLEPKKEDNKVVLQAVPADKADYLWFAAQARLQIWASFTELSAYQYRTEYRNNLIEWLNLMIRWVDTYGITQAPAGESTESIRAKIQEAYNTAVRESGYTAAYLTESTKQHIATLKKLADKLAASASKANVPLTTK